MFILGHPIWALLLVTGAASSRVPNPVSRVITLLEGLKGKVESDGQTEATSYEAFACFCKSTTGSRSQSILGGQDEIDTQSGDIVEKSARVADEEADVIARKAKHTELSQELRETVSRCTAQKAGHEATAADLAKAIASLQSALTALRDKKATIGFAAVRKSVSKTLDLADALNLVPSPRRKVFDAFLQGGEHVDPTSPQYQYHSQNIIDLLDGLETDFTEKKAEADKEYAATSKGCNGLQESTGDEIKANLDAISQAEGRIETLKEDIANARAAIVLAEKLLKEDKEYLRELTERCSDRAHEWDQRSQMRSDEIKAIVEALAILNDRVVPADEVNERQVLVQEHERRPIQDNRGKALSFLQGLTLRQGPRRTVALGPNKTSTPKAFLRPGDCIGCQVQREKASAMLEAEGRRLKSSTLSSLVLSIKEDPFQKVKSLIQQLIERLLQEAAQEATSKGFCDTQVGKALQDRDFRFEAMQKIHVELKALEAKKDELTSEIETLGTDIEGLQTSLKNAADAREADKAANNATLVTAEEGLAAITEALSLLKSFYSTASRAKVALLQSTPDDIAANEPDYKGAYRGQQDGSTTVIALLQSIKEDFERTIEQTQTNEKAAAADFVKFDRTSRSDIGGKSTKVELDTQDLETTNSTIASKLADLGTETGLLDDALKMLEELRPVCMETGLSHADRVTKRNEEIAALKKALCYLDPEKSETDC